MTKSVLETSNFTYSTNDGINLVAESWGNPDNPPVLLSHGGGQTRHAWKRTGERLAEQGWYAVAYDHRGHGQSDWSSDGIYNLSRFAADQKRIAETFTQPPVLIGASLGGLSSLAAQSDKGIDGATNESLFAAIVLVDITPQMNQQGAMKIMAFMGDNMTKGFADLDEAASAIASYTGREKRVNHDGLKKNLRLSDDGRYRWHWDPAFLMMREDNEHNTESLMKACRDSTSPLLLVRGMLSEIVTDAVAKEFLSLVPNAEYTNVEDASHMVAGDKNDVFCDSILPFLEKIAQ